MENNEIQEVQENGAIKTQRNKFTVVVILFLVLLIVLTLIGWEDLSSDTSNVLGNGSKAITLSVQLPTETVVYEINTDGYSLDDVLMEHNLANFTHLGMGSIINSISGYTLQENIDWYDVYVNGTIVYLQTSNIVIENGANYSIVIIKM